MAMKLYSEVDVENIAYEIRKKLGARLPKEYVEVDYISSREGARIATGVSGNNDNLKIQLKFSNVGSSNYGSIFGNYSGEAYNCTRLIFSTSSTNFLSYINTKANGGGVFNSNITLGNTHIVEMVQGNTSFDGTSATKAITKGTDNSNEISIFSSNISSAAPTSYQTNIYYFKIYDDNVLIRDYVPCYRKSDNAIGLYDLVNNTFVSTYNNYGSFVYGEEIYPKYKISQMANAIDEIYENILNELEEI